MRDLGLAGQPGDLEAQPDGKILAALTDGASQDAVVLRRQADGTPDTTFGVGGTVRLAFGGNETATALALAPDGMIVVAGSSDCVAAVRRLHGDGSPDTTFGVAGQATIPLDGCRSAVDVAVQPDGKLLVLTGPWLHRLLPNGAIDHSFGQSGLILVMSNWPARVVAVQSDGRILVGGQDAFGVRRYLSDGSPDTTFGNGGLAAVPTFTDRYVNAIAIDNSGRIAVAGAIYGRVVSHSINQGQDGGYIFSLARFTASGQPDPTFGDGGAVQTGFGDIGQSQGGIGAAARRLVFGADGTLLAGGVDVSDAAFARYQPDGALDSSFDGDGRLDVSFGPYSDGTIAGMVVTGNGGILSLSEARLARIAEAAVAKPSAPLNVYLATGDGKLTASWMPPVYDNGSPISRYVVTVDAEQEGPRILDTTEPAITISPLLNGRPYTVQVAATNAAGTGPSSDPVVGVPRTIPGIPADVTAVAGDTSAALQWSAPGDGGSPITFYRITVLYQSASIRVLSVGGTTATVSGLVNDVPYTFRVEAFNIVGPGAPSEESNVVTPTGPRSKPPPGTVIVPATAKSGYWMVGSDGAVYAFGDAKSYGNAAVGFATAVDLEPTPSGNGYWVVDDLGRVFQFGDAVHHGNVDRSKLATGEKVTSLSATSNGGGYWIFTNRGRVLTFGIAAFLGDVSNLTLAGPVLDSIVTPSGQGYYMVASDGGIFAFGDAKFYGSMGGRKLNAPVQSLVPDSDGVGYWLVASDGGIFAFQGDFKGSMGGTKLNKPVTGMVRAGRGYLMVGEDGGIFDFSGDPTSFKGSLGANPPAKPITSVAVLEAK